MNNNNNNGNRRKKNNREKKYISADNKAKKQQKTKRKVDDDESYGIPQKEIPEPKRFVTNAIPFFDMSYEVLNNFENPRFRDKYSFGKGLFQRICVSYSQAYSYS
jgi:hypothetical protein